LIFGNPGVGGSSDFAGRVSRTGLQERCKFLTSF
jgi:hypothetical protein